MEGMGELSAGTDKFAVMSELLMEVEPDMLALRLRAGWLSSNDVFLVLNCFVMESEENTEDTSKLLTGETEPESFSLYAFAFARLKSQFVENKD